MFRAFARHIKFSLVRNPDNGIPSAGVCVADAPRGTDASRGRDT
jgi:hypothetical protein